MDAMLSIAVNNRVKYRVNERDTLLVKHLFTRLYPILYHKILS